MADEEKKKSFWETLPGIITALGGLFMGLAAVIAALNGGAKESVSKPDAQAEAAAAKVEAERAKAEAAEAKALAEELERKLAEVKARSEEAESIVFPSSPKQGDTMKEDITGMEFVYVPGGCFQMGSVISSDKDHQDDEGPVHEVCVDSFWMGKYEVTQGQWQKITGDDPSYFKKGSCYPVENISWDETKTFIDTLNRKAGKQYRLPTEAEWEYACRANSSGKYCGSNDLDAVAWYEKNSDKSTQPVGKKQKNAFGLYDMSGNVWEWCADWYNKDYYASSPKNNPQDTDSVSSSRVIRGGGWFSTPKSVCAAYRNGDTPDNRSYDMGFRLLLSGQQSQASR